MYIQNVFISFHKKFDLYVLLNFKFKVTHQARPSGCIKVFIFCVLLYDYNA